MQILDQMNTFNNDDDDKSNAPQLHDKTKCLLVANDSDSDGRKLSEKEWSRALASVKKRRSLWGLLRGWGGECL